VLRARHGRTTGLELDSGCAAVAVGFLGGFDILDFNHETLALAASGAIGEAALNIVVTIAGGLLAGSLGMLVARQLVA
jgi:fluoride ion exporter CrcB/FEX